MIAWAEIREWAAQQLQLRLPKRPGHASPCLHEGIYGTRDVPSRSRVKERRIDKELNKFLEIWSNQELWNKVKYEDVDESDDSKLKFDPEYNYRIGERTPLMYATAFAGYPVIRYLLDHGSERAAVDSSGANAEKYLADNKLI